MLLATAPSLAEQYGPLEVVGFFKNEYSMCDNCSSGLVNPTAYDPRGVLSPPVPMVNQGGDSEDTGRNLFLAQLTLGLSHEFDNAFKIEAKTSGRMRNTDADIYDNWMTELYAGVSHPTYGSLQVGKMTSRAWSRSDDFAYPVGLSSPWAESGAGYGLFPEAVRYATREFEIPFGKVRFEASYAEADTRDPLNPSSLVADPPDPSLYEIFIQYSNEKNLIELIYQDSEGGRQSSFQKGAFYGAQGNTNGAVSSPDYEEPSQNVIILQGNYWMNEQWKFTYGLRRSEWSGQAQQCDYGPVSVLESTCFWDQAGFNYSDQINKVYSARSWDAILGAAYTRGKWTYTAGSVYLDKASTDNPVEWGQDNTAIFLNLGVYRDLPELSLGGVFKAEVYAGLGRVMFDRQGPAPLSMPNNTAFGGVDPRISESGNFLTLGANLNF
jgi:predicted porin